MTNIMPFYFWLIEKASTTKTNPARLESHCLSPYGNTWTNGPITDLAYDMNTDFTFPSDRKYLKREMSRSELRRSMENIQACDKALETFDDAWKQYEKEAPVDHVTLSEILDEHPSLKQVIRIAQLSAKRNSYYRNVTYEALKGIITDYVGHFEKFSNERHRTCEAYDLLRDEIAKELRI